MKKFYLSLLVSFIFVLCCGFIFAGCSNKNGAVVVPQPQFSIANSEIQEDGSYRITIPEDTTSLNLTDYVSHEEGTDWKLYLDENGENEIPTRIASIKNGLNKGSNIFYIVFSGSFIKTIKVDVYRYYLCDLQFSGYENLNTRIQLGREHVLDSKPEERQGYTFRGWATTYYGKKVDSITPKDETTMTVYPVWEANRYTVTLVTNGGKLENTEVEVTYGNNYRDSSFGTPVKEGYDFTGWYFEDGTRWETWNEYHEYWTNTCYRYTEDITLVAHYELASYYISLSGECDHGGHGYDYRLSYDAEKVGNYNVAYNSPITLIAEEIQGHTFVGWHLRKIDYFDEEKNPVWKEEFLSEELIYSTLVPYCGTEDKRFTVVYFVAKYTAEEFICAFESAIGELPQISVKFVNHLGSINLSDFVPIMPYGYEFLGWLYQDEICNSLFGVVQDIMLTADYKSYWHTCYLDPGKGELDETEVKFCSFDNLALDKYNPTIPIGYESFDGWYLEDTQVVELTYSTDVILTAKYTPKQYTVIIIINDSHYKDAAIPTGLQLKTDSFIKPTYISSGNNSYKFSIATDVCFSMNLLSSFTYKNYYPTTTVKFSYFSYSVDGETYSTTNRTEAIIQPPHDLVITVYYE